MESLTYVTIQCFLNFQESIRYLKRFFCLLYLHILSWKVVLVPLLFGLEFIAGFFLPSFWSQQKSLQVSFPSFGSLQTLLAFLKTSSFSSSQLSLPLPTTINSPLAWLILQASEHSFPPYQTFSSFSATTQETHKISKHTRPSRGIKIQMSPLLHCQKERENSKINGILNFPAFFKFQEFLR